LTEIERCTQVGLIIFRLVVAVALITAIDSINMKVLPWPPGVRFNHPATIRGAEALPDRAEGRPPQSIEFERQRCRG